ncbi:MAG: HEAT repeat domain-containing protein [Elainellaceae cyanobacterium]
MADAKALIQAVEQADSKTALVVAVRRLSAIRDPTIVPVLIQVLGYNNPGAAVAAVEGLTAIGDPAVPALLEQLDGYNYGARAWAIRAVSGIAHPDGLATLLDAVQADFALSVRRAAAYGLGKLRWQLLPPDQREAAQQQSAEALLGALNDGEWIVRYAAIVGLQSLTTAISCDWRSQVLAKLQAAIANDDAMAVRARAAMAIEELTEYLEGN